MGIGVLRRVLDEIEHGPWQRARGAQVGLQFFQLGLVRQLFVPEEINHFLVADAPGQLVDIVTGVNQHSPPLPMTSLRRVVAATIPLSPGEVTGITSVNKARASLPPKTAIAGIF